MSREWKPGDVAMVTVEGFKPEVAVFTENGRWHDASDMSLDANSPDSTYRPLVVIDPEDREAVERLLVTYGRQFTGWTPETDTNVTRLQAALREYANPRVPKPDEPQGLGAVVEDDAEVWVRTETQGAGWCPSGETGSQEYRCWADFSPAVRVLSPGVEVDQ